MQRTRNKRASYPQSPVRAADAGRYALLLNLKLSSAKRVFLSRIKNAGRSLRTLTPSDAIELMTSFYREERAEGCVISSGGDMLLSQWGTYDWGEGESFEFNITRQLIAGDSEDEDIFQLSLTFRFRPTAALRQLGSGDRWCLSLDELERFREFVYSSEPFLAVGHEVADGVKLEYDIAA
jgi:hypothetical protein